MNNKIIIIFIVLSSCSTKKQMQSMARQSNITESSVTFVEEVRTAQQLRDNELKKLTVYLPDYDTIKDLRVLVDLSVLRINSRYDSTIIALEIKKRAELKSYEDSLTNKTKKKFLGLF